MGTHTRALFSSAIGIGLMCGCLRSEEALVTYDVGSRCRNTPQVKLVLGLSAAGRAEALLVSVLPPRVNRGRHLPLERVRAFPMLRDTVRVDRVNGVCQ